MPLIRYELQNEYSLATGELLSATPKHNPTAVFEGVAMVGLVGVVRQLGNLAEFAADLFHELHDEIVATVARSHHLVLKVQQLETKLPYFEKAYFSENNRLRFAYKRSAEWHARICVHQNHCSEGDLPGFIQNSYQKCRDPPKFSLLDKFDIAGAGACPKRYSDPAFFKMRWASSELKKAEKIREDRKSRRVKRSNNCGNRKVNGCTYEPRPTPRRVRYSSLSSDTWDSYSDISTPKSIGGIKSKMGLQSSFQIPKENSFQGLTGKKTCGLNEQKGLPSHPRKMKTLRELLEADERIDSLNLSAKEIEEAETLYARLKGFDVTHGVEHQVEEAVQGFVSEKDHLIIEEIVKQKNKKVDDIANEADQIDEGISGEEDQIVEDIASEADHIDEDIESEENRFVDAMSSMDSGSDRESISGTDSPIDLVKGNGDLKNYSLEDESLDGERDDLSVHEMDHISEHQLGSVNLSVFTEESSSMSPSQSLDYSTEEDENAFVSNQAQAQAQTHTHTQFWLPTEKFAMNVAGIRVLDTKGPSIPQKFPVELASEQADSSPTWQPSYNNSSSPALTAPTEVSEESPMHCLLPESMTHSREQSSETSHEPDFLEKERCYCLTNGFGAKPALHKTQITGGYSLPQESGDSKSRCTKEICPNSPPFPLRKSSEIRADNHPLARRTLRFTDDTVNPKPPRLSDCSHSSSSVSCSSPSNADAKPTSPSASSLSSVSPPKSPIFSALHSPMSPITTSYYSSSSKSRRKLSSEMMRSCSPSLTPKLLLSPSLKGTPPSPPPFPPLKLNSNQTMHSPSGLFNRPLQAPPTPPPPPPPPPPRIYSKLVQTVSRVQLGSRSVLMGQRHDDLIKSISMYDRSKLRKVTIEKRSPRPRVMSERDVILEQIKNKSFTLRRIAIEKRQKLDSINVAAILEKANAIRQAFAGSDEEDTQQEWIDVQK